MPRRMHWLLLALLAIAGPASAQFRWVDENGRVNYGDAPPSDAKGIARIGAVSSNDDPTLGLPFEVRRAMSQFPVTLYTGDQCEPCDQARLYLQRRGLPFSEVSVETDVEAAELKRRTGTVSLPVMTLGRLPHVGFKMSDWSKALSAAGYPEQINLPASYRQAPPSTMLPRNEGPVNGAASVAPAASKSR